MKRMQFDLTKDYFQKAWGDGYYERFSFGIGIDNVCEKCITPFTGNKTALEIGPGGGSFTEFMIDKFSHLAALDVIPIPDKFREYENFTYHELPTNDYTCSKVETESIDFCFSYGLFCHLSNDAIKKYIESVKRVLKSGGDFVFMLAYFEYSRNHIENPDSYVLGDFLPMGHFYQDLRTIDLVVSDGWKIVESNMTPTHRDILVHLRKTK